MKRFHVHVSVADLNESVGFYSTLFAAPPSVLKSDYAKWMLDDPRVNFAISVHGADAGLDHLGIQVESADDLNQIGARLTDAGRSVLEQKNASCCYARGDKGWVSDPSGISWETFVTFGDITNYGNDVAPRAARDAATATESCCAPALAPATSCCGAAKA
jgi:hypothetical protein